MQSTCESGPRAGYDGYKRKRGSKVHIAVDTLGHLLAVHVTPANEQERAQVAELARQVQEITGETVKVAFADQGYTGEDAAEAASNEGIDLQVIKLQEAKKGFVLLPGRSHRRLACARQFSTKARHRLGCPGQGWGSTRRCPVVITRTEFVVQRNPNGRRIKISSMGCGW
jgi:transposase